MAPAGSTSFDAELIIPGVPLGDYFVLVQTDILNNISESADSNNIAASLRKLTISVPELELDKLQTRQLHNNQGIYYRIEIPESLVGETMQVSLDSKTTTGNNELFLSFGEVPTRSNHKYTSVEPFKSDQQVIISELQAGTYYLLAYGTVQSAIAQEIDLSATIIPFQIQSIHSNRGGNTGKVTVKLEGAKFEKNMEVLLTGGTDSVVGENLILINSTTVYITFDLATNGGIALGRYSVTATKTNGETTELPDGFEVIQGVKQKVTVTIDYPPSTRPNRVVPMTLNFGNTGNVDVPVPTIAVISRGGAPIALKPADLELKLLDISTDLREANGPQNILRPGATGAVTIYAKSNGRGSMLFKLIQLD